MAKSGLPKSVRKFIRLEKARIRRQVLDFRKQREMTEELHKQFYKKEENEQENNKTKSQNRKEVEKRQKN